MGSASPIHTLFDLIHRVDPRRRRRRVRRRLVGLDAGVIESAGYVSGLGTGQAGATIDYGVGLATGTQSPSGPVDVAKGIAKGRQKDQN